MMAADSKTNPMVVRPGVMAQIIREGMDHYWKVIGSASDDGLSPEEIGWKVKYREDLARFERKFGPELDRLFKEK